MPRELTRSELADAIPCPIGSVDWLAGRAGVTPIRTERRNGQDWRIWGADAVARMRRAKRKQRRTAGRARKGGK